MQFLEAPSNNFLEKSLVASEQSGQFQLGKKLENIWTRSLSTDILANIIVLVSKEL